MSFADTKGDPDINDYGQISVSGWERDDIDEVYWRNADGASVEFSGDSFASFDDTYTYAELGDLVYMDIYPTGTDEVGQVLLNDEPLYPDEESGSYSFTVGKENIIEISIVPNKIASISYTPNGQHEAWNSCTELLDDPYWYINNNLGDTIKVNYAEGDSVTYVCKEVSRVDEEDGGEYIQWEFVNSADEEDYLQWWPDFDTRIPYASYKSGAEATIQTYVVCNSVRTSAPISLNVKFAYYHEEYWDGLTNKWVSPLKKTNAVNATCTTAGNIDYWQCQRCNKYFKDQDGVYEIASGAWVVPATGHKFDKTKVTKKAGLLKNGTQVQVCSVCGANGKTTVIPGWSKYYVKAPKTVAGKKSFTVKWGKQSKANLKKFTGYQIRYSTKKSMAKAKMVKVKKTATSQTVKKLKKKTKYFVQVRTYTKKSGKLFYSKWSAKKTVKTK